MKQMAPPPPLPVRSIWVVGTLALAFAAIAAMLLTIDRQPHGSGPLVVVYKDPQCECCGDWIDYLVRNGFAVKMIPTHDWPLTRQSLGVADKFEACHTATVEGYLIEGHVPAEDIHRLLRERPRAKGLAVPGMPVGSPGMEDGDKQDPYDVVLMGDDDSATVYAHH